MSYFIKQLLKLLLSHIASCKYPYFIELNETEINSILMKAYVCEVIVSKVTKIRNRYNQVPHLTKNTCEKVINFQLDTTNGSQEVSPFPAGALKAQINRRAQRHNKHKAEIKHKSSTKEVPPWNGQ